jgi:putative PIN family toxin of toxin-antitoxin system
MSTLRAVLDTNVLISGIAYPNSIPGKLLAAWRQGAYEVLLSDYILDEFRRVMPRLAHRHGLSSDEVDDLVDSWMLLVDLVEPVRLAADSVRDAADIAVLGTWVAARQLGAPCYLVTGDKDLLALAGEYPIVTPAEFWVRHGEIVV